MAVGANTYGTVQRVMDRLGDLFPDGDASTIDRIDKSQVERMLDDVASEMNNHLEVYGYTVPIAQATNPVAFDYARTANVAGACVMVLNSMPGLAFDPENPDELGGNRRAAFQAQYKRFFERVEKRQIVAAKAVSIVDRFRVGSATDRKTGDEKKPVFRRDTFDFPGSVTRMEPDDE